MSQPARRRDAAPEPQGHLDASLITLEELQQDQPTIDVLNALGYQRIDTPGVRFDPARHEAAGSVPAADGVPAGTVVDVHRAGYTGADGTLVRPAMVTVAQAPEHRPVPAAQDS